MRRSILVKFSGMIDIDVKFMNMFLNFAYVDYYVRYWHFNDF